MLAELRHPMPATSANQTNKLSRSGHKIGVSSIDFSLRPAVVTIRPEG